MIILNATEENLSKYNVHELRPETKKELQEKVRNINFNKLFASPEIRLSYIDEWAADFSSTISNDLLSGIKANLMQIAEAVGEKDEEALYHLSFGPIFSIVIDVPPYMLLRLKEAFKAVRVRAMVIVYRNGNPIGVIEV
jgi:hypothetical protein